MEPKAMEWIERYSAEVGQMLPAARRRDIELEIRSLLMDEAEASADGAPVREADVLALLERYPSPMQMAGRYGAPRHLIGPALYPTYLEVVWLVGVIVTVVNTIAVVAGIFNGADASPDALFGFAVSYAQGLLTSIAIVTVIFALVERQGSEEVAALAEKGWSPRSLPALGAGNRASLSDLFTTIVTALGSVLVLNLFVRGDGAITIPGGDPITLALFSERFLAFVPWLTAIWLGELGVALVVLARRRWERGTRLAMVALGLAGAALLVTMLAGGALGASAGMERWVDAGVAIALLATLYELVSHLVGLLRARRAAAPSLPTNATVA